MSTTLNGMGRPKKSEPTEQLRIPRSVVRRIRRLATHLGVEAGEFVAARLATILDREEERMLKDIEKERAKADEPK